MKKYRLYSPFKFIVKEHFNENKWKEYKSEYLTKLQDVILNDEKGFIRYCAILANCMECDRIAVKWKEIFRELIICALTEDIRLLERLSSILDNSKLKIHEILCYSEIMVDTLTHQLASGEMSVERMVDLCLQEKMPKTKRNIIKYSEYVLKYLNDYRNQFEDFWVASKQFFETEQDPKKKIAYFHLLGKAGALTKDWMKDFCELVYHCSNDFRVKYYYGMYEIPWLVFNYPKYLFADYYSKRKKYFEDIANAMDIDKKYKIGGEKKKIKRIAIMVLGLPKNMYASTRLEIYLANQLINNGYEVTIFVADTNYIQGDFDYFLNPTGTRRSLSSDDKESHEIISNSNLKIFYNKEDSFTNMYQNYLKEIYKYSPDFIIDVMSENAVFSYNLLDTFPIVHVPLAGFSSSAIFDKILVRDMQKVIDTNAYMPSVDIEKAIECNLYLPYDLVKKKNFYRRLHGIKKDDFVIITVGNRLSSEIDFDFANKMKLFLENNLRIKWILVGNWQNKYIFLDELINSGRIISLPFFEHLPDIYRECDLFVNPLRSGGGGSIAMFIQMGKPAVVSDMPSDIMPFIKEENCIKGGIEGIFNMAESIYHDRILGDELARRQRERLMSDEFSVVNYANQVINAFNSIERVSR